VPAGEIPVAGTPELHDAFKDFATGGDEALAGAGGGGTLVGIVEPKTVLAVEDVPADRGG
jgi:hypothetical protein